MSGKVSVVWGGQIIHCIDVVPSDQAFADALLSSDQRWQAVMTPGSSSSRRCQTKDRPEGSSSQTNKIVVEIHVSIENCV